MTPVFAGWTARVITRPEVTAGPIRRARRPANVSLPRLGFFGTSGVAAGAAGAAEAAAAAGFSAGAFFATAGTEAGDGAGAWAWATLAQSTARRVVDRRVMGASKGRAILPAMEVDGPDLGADRT